MNQSHSKGCLCLRCARWHLGSLLLLTLIGCGWQAQQSPVQESPTAPAPTARPGGDPGASRSAAPRLRVDPAASNGEFPAHWDERWSATQSAGSCLLSLRVPRYGSVQFLGGTAGGGQQRLMFELRASRDLMSARPISWRRRAPAWHPRYPQRDDWFAAVPIPGYGARLGNPMAERVALDLYAGYEVDIAAAGLQGQQPAVFLRVSALGFRPAYDAFRRCQETGLPSSLLALRRTRILFATGSHRLSPADLAQLRAVADYLQADPDVAQIFVDGHTDAVGAERDNLALSKRRAQAVFDALVQAGVDPTRLVLRYHGERYPVQRAAAKQAVAANRRATVRIEMRAPAATQAFVGS